MAREAGRHGEERCSVGRSREREDCAAGAAGGSGSGASPRREPVLLVLLGANISPASASDLQQIRMAALHYN